MATSSNNLTPEALTVGDVVTVEMPLGPAKGVVVRVGDTVPVVVGDERTMCRELHVLDPNGRGGLWMAPVDAAVTVHRRVAVYATAPPMRYHVTEDTDGPVGVEVDGRPALRID